MVFFCSEKIINLDVSNSIVSIIIFIFEENIFFFTNYPMKLRKKRWKIQSVKFTFSTT